MLVFPDLSISSFMMFMASFCTLVIWLLVMASGILVVGFWVVGLVLELTETFWERGFLWLRVAANKFPLLLGSC